MREPNESVSSQTAPDALAEETPVELYHPSLPDEPTVTLSRNGLCDRRWPQPLVAWRDIRDIERIRGAQLILITLHEPEYYIARLPFFQRIVARVKTLFRPQKLCIETDSLGMRSKEFNAVIHRFWFRYRGNFQRRKKRRSATPHVTMPHPVVRGDR